MFNWIRKKPKKDDEPKKVRFGPEEIADEDLEGLRVASLKYVVGIDGQVYIEFFWDEDVSEDANSAFSELFSKVNSGDLLESSVQFIEKTLEEAGQEDEFAKFFTSILEKQKERIQPFLESMGISEKSDNEVIVKPTDVSRMTFRGNQS